MLGCGVPQVLYWIKLSEGTLGDVKGMGGAPGMFHVGGCVVVQCVLLVCVLIQVHDLFSVWWCAAGVYVGWVIQVH